MRPVATIKRCLAVIEKLSRLEQERKFLHFVYQLSAAATRTALNNSMTVAHRFRSAYPRPALQQTGRCSLNNTRILQTTVVYSYCSRYEQALTPFFGCSF